MAEHETKTVNVFHRAGGPKNLVGIPFVLTYIGAAIYFVQQTNGSFLEVIVALLQALVWPVYVMYHVLLALGV